MATRQPRGASQNRLAATNYQDTVLLRSRSATDAGKTGVLQAHGLMSRAQGTHSKGEKRMENTEQINEKFLEEYASEDAVRKYTTETAGFGINYLLSNDYATVYLSAVDSYLRTSPARPLRLLEFGCGGGVTLFPLPFLLARKRICLEHATLANLSP